MLSKGRNTRRGKATERGGASKIVLVLLASLLLLITIFSLERPNNLTGRVTGSTTQAGNVTEANISRSSSFWQGFFGELTINTSASTPSVVAQGGSMTEFNLTLPCSGGEVYMSIKSSLDFPLVTAGSVTAVDNYLLLASTDPESGTQVFTNLSSFTVNGTGLSNAPTTYTSVKNSPGNSTFNLGILAESGTLVFVSSIRFDTIGFDGNSHDYQIMVPVNQSSVTYHFFSDCAVAAPAPEAAPEAQPSQGNPSEPTPTPAAVAPVLPEEILPPVIEIIEKEGKLLVPSYPLVLVVRQGERIRREIQIHNIGEGSLTNIFMFISGLPLNMFTITPERYERLLPGDVRGFTLEFSGDLDPGTYNIEMLISSDQGSTRISGVLIIEEVVPVQPEKLPLVGAAAGFLRSHGDYLAYTALGVMLFSVLYIAIRKIQGRNIGKKRHRSR